MGHKKTVCDAVSFSISINFEVRAVDFYQTYVKSTSTFVNSAFDAYMRLLSTYVIKFAYFSCVKL